MHTLALDGPRGRAVPFVSLGKRGITSGSFADHANPSDEGPQAPPPYRANFFYRPAPPRDGNAPPRPPDERPLAAIHYHHVRRQPPGPRRLLLNLSLPSELESEEESP